MEKEHFSPGLALGKPDVEQGCGRKLLEGESVEVRMTEKGLRGSWHPAKVLKALSGKRLVQYEEILANNGSLLKETVRVGRGVDGELSASPKYARLRKKANVGAEDRRLSIRPIPPPTNIPFEKWQAGTAVESSYNDAWWEGYLVTDAPLGKGGSVKVVYPDEPQFGVEAVESDQLRLGQDWDEVTGTWSLKDPRTDLPTGDSECVQPEMGGGGSRRRDKQDVLLKISSTITAPSLDHQQSELDQSCTCLDLTCTFSGRESGRVSPESQCGNGLEEAKKRRGRPCKNSPCPVEGSEKMSKKEEGKMTVRKKTVTQSPGSTARKENGRVAEAADGAHKHPGKKSKAKSLCSEKEGKEQLYFTKQKVLCRIIDAGIVEEGSPLTYSTEKHRLAGIAFRGGVQCSCCDKVLSLSGFEAHAKSTLKRPSANIYLDDGRSLAECFREACCSASREQPGEMKVGPEEEVDYSDDLCRLCGDGGELICCESCPVTFHLDCIGLKSVPDGDWYCPACRCAICGGSDFDPEFSQKTVVLCDQCEREYHVGCMNNQGMPVMDALPDGNWFCSRQCELISEELKALVGRQLPLEDGFSWTLLQCPEGLRSDDVLLPLDNRSNINEALRLLPAKQAKKMRTGLKVMHECFNPIHDPRTQEDLIPSIVNNRRTRYADFSRFYTALLEKDDELITVATIRVFGSCLAEMPLIGTRFEYRRKGMCRRLMNAVEELLANLGVVRLVLPAVAEVKDTWRGGFGFQDIPEDQKQGLAEVGILVFPGTTTLQKPIALPTPKVHADRKQLRLLRGRVLAACNHQRSKNGKQPSAFDSAVAGGFAKPDSALPGRSLLSPATLGTFGSVQLGNWASDGLAVQASADGEMRRALNDVVSFQAEPGNLPMATLGISASVRVRPDGIFVDLEGKRLPANCWLVAAAKMRRKGLKAGKKVRQKESEEGLAAKGPLPGARAICSSDRKKQKGAARSVDPIGTPQRADGGDRKDVEMTNGDSDRHTPQGSEEKALTASGNKWKPDEAGSSPDESKRLLSGRTRSRQVKMPERFRDSNMEVTMNRNKSRTSEELAVEAGLCQKDDMAASKKPQKNEAAGDVTDMKGFAPKCAACKQIGQCSPKCTFKFQFTPEPCADVSPEVTARKMGSNGLVDDDHGHSRTKWGSVNGKRGVEPSQDTEREEALRKKKSRTMADDVSGYVAGTSARTFPETASDAKRRKLDGIEGRRQQIWAKDTLGGSAPKGLQFDLPRMGVTRMLDPRRGSLVGSSMLEVRLTPKMGDNGSVPGAGLKRLLVDFQGSDRPPTDSPLRRASEMEGISSREGQFRGTMQPNGLRNTSTGKEGSVEKQSQGHREQQQEIQRPWEATMRPPWGLQQPAPGNWQQARPADHPVSGGKVYDSSKLPGPRGIQQPTGLGKRLLRTGEARENGVYSPWGGVAPPSKDGVWESRSPGTTAPSSSELGTSLGTAYTAASGFRSTAFGVVKGPGGGGIQGRGHVQPLTRPDQRLIYPGINSLRQGGLPGSSWATRGLKMEPVQSRSSLWTDVARSFAQPLKLSKASAAGKARAVERQSGGLTPMVGTGPISAGTHQGLVRGSPATAPGDAMASAVAGRVASDIAAGVPVIEPLLGKVANGGLNGYAATGRGGYFPSRETNVAAGPVRGVVGSSPLNGWMAKDPMGGQAAGCALDKGKTTAISVAELPYNEDELLSSDGKDNDASGSCCFANRQRASCHFSSEMPEPEARVSSSTGVAFRSVVVAEQVK